MHDDFPAPDITPESRPFWEAAARGTFLIRRCPACGTAHFYPRSLCPICHQAETDWVESPGEGEIYTWTVMRKSPKGPFALGYLTLDEGPRVYVCFRPEDHAGLAIGKRARIVFDPVQGGARMLFATLI
ncbi:Zn-ribbon domain-containing OB-fold protein [Pseudooceanicola aestuarii]|uniref:Zn-ribbon domain-containing OB-fold protein n=1 Tax=Pseudooceanicola aestuarii TaxID=2697319 RepID=UPI0013CFAD9E|nr:OB-fold domain-containing protein [Pseudooceanicola aestuarii]